MRSIKIKSFESVIGSFAHNARKEKPIEEVSAIDKYLYRGKSMINPTLTHLNYSLINNLETYKNIFKECYKREDSAVAFESIITYPTTNPPKDKDGNIIKQKEFFEAFVDILQNDEEIKKHFGFLISANVHLDESSPHMHFITAPIEELEKPKRKEERYYVEKLIKKTGEIRQVERRRYTEYKKQFAPSKMMNREFFINQHYLFEDKLKERGINAELITPEVREFNKFKEQLEKDAKEQIKNATTKEEIIQIIDDKFNLLQSLNPKKEHKAVKKMLAEQYNQEKKEVIEEFESKLEKRATDKLLEAGLMADNIKNEAKSILEDSKIEADKIIDEANKSKKSILDDAGFESNYMIEKAEKTADTIKKTAIQEKKDIIENANNEAKVIIFNAKRKAEKVDKEINNTLDEVEEMRESSNNTKEVIEASALDISKISHELLPEQIAQTFDKKVSEKLSEVYKIIEASNKKYEDFYDKHENNFIDEER